MPLKLSEPIYEDLPLEDTDKNYGNEGEPTVVVIKKAAQHEHERRQDFFKRMERKYTPVDNDDDPIEVTLIQDLSQEALKRLEVQLTMVGCNILNEDGKPLFKFLTKGGHPRLNMHPVKFAEAWGKLPPDVADEIHRKVIEVNLQWDPEGEVD